MAAKSKAKKIRFEMGFGGLFTLCLASFVLLLWMFVLGFWAGKRLLGPVPVENIQIQPSTPILPPQPQVAEEKPQPAGAPKGMVAAPAAPGPENKGEASLPTEKISPEPSKPAVSKPKVAESKPKPPEVKLPSLTPKKTYFSLRVASVKDQASAEKEAERWRKKGYVAFVKRADLGKKGIWYRIYVGKYHSIQEAKKASEKIKGLQYITPFTE